MKISGIYKIQSVIKPERCYIGSAVNIKNRWGSHLCDLRKNRHENGRLQNHYNKYRETDLIFSILLGCEKDDLIKTEQYFIDSYNPYFNICKNAGNTLGRKHSEETKGKYRIMRKGIKPCKKCLDNSVLTNKGKRLTEEHKSKIRISHIGKGHTEEIKKILSQKHKGKILSKEHREKIRLAGIGRKPSEETRKKLSASNMGHIISDETKHKISLANIGRVVSNEVKERISKSQKGKIISKETKDKMKVAAFLREAKKRAS
jgi:group I intron endonuclease